MTADEYDRELAARMVGGVSAEEHEAALRGAETTAPSGGGSLWEPDDPLYALDELVGLQDGDVDGDVEFA